MKHCEQSRESLWISVFRFLGKEVQVKELVNPGGRFGNTANFSE
jgi:hypothetical protein